MRFLADMGISPVTVAWLCREGHDATHLRDEGLRQLPDDLVLEKARAEKRILLTCDLDFGQLVAAGGHDLPSVILFRLSDMRPSNVNARLDIALAEFRQDLLSGSVIVIGEASIRVRRLPIGKGIE
ncbi:MAG: DUF5615 family PIN-like protein [Armatimonadota bacterium]|nr:DUF5615 family PIN-like protein [Armatimonadota bacterium]